MTAALPLGLLAAAGFLSSAGARVVDPLLHPMSRDFGVSVPQLWVIIAAFTLPYGLIQLLLGPMGDRFGKLRVIGFALVGYAVFTGACALAGNITSLAVLRALAGAASAGLIPVSMAYIGDAVPYAQRQVMLGRFLTGVVMAQVLAGPVGGIFGEFIGWRGVFVVLAGLAVLLAALFMVRTRALPDPRARGRVFNPLNYLRMARHRTGRLILLAAALDGAFFVGCFPYLAPFLHERFGLPYAQVGVVLACFGLGALAYTRLARQLLVRVGESGMVLAGGLLMAFGLALAVVARHPALFVLVEFCLGLGFFMLHGVLQARATEMLPRARATAVATFACLLFLGQSLGVLAVGAAIARWGYGTAFLMDAGAVALLAAWLWRVLGGTVARRTAATT